MCFILLILLVLPLSTVSVEYSQDFFRNIINSTTISPTCYQQYQKFILNLQPNITSWAFQMVNANSEVPKGLVTLKFENLGDFQECINVKNEDITGQYCLGFISNTTLLRDTASFIPPVWGLCLPSGCTTDDTNIIGEAVLTDLLHQDIEINFSDFLCQTVKDVQPKFGTTALISITVLATLVVVVLLSTMYDFYCIYYDLKQSQMNFFSVYSNSKLVFNMKRQNEHLQCLDGLKFLSMLWVVLVHQFSVPPNGSVTNIKSLQQWPEKISSMFVLSGDLSVDTFLTIGGTLLSYGFMTARFNNVSFNLLQFYLHRYLRLTPPFAAVVLVSGTLLKYMGSGPKWPFFTLYFQKNCEKNWWSALLYVQNYVNPTTMCVGQTWYLNVDMQLCLISPIVLFLLWKYPKMGLMLSFFGVVLSISGAFYEVWRHELPAVSFGVYSTRSSAHQYFYLLTHTRATTWFVGVVLGYFIFKIKHTVTKVYLNKFVLCCIWVLCFGILLTCVFGGHHFFVQEYDPVVGTFYAVLVRPVWALGIAWVILGCTVYKGPFNWVLSLPIFQVLNKFTYCIYLTHVSTLYGIAFGRKWPEYFSEFDTMYKFWGTLWISAGFAILLVFMVECPVMMIEKQLLGFGKSKKPKIGKGNGGVYNAAYVT